MTSRAEHLAWCKQRALEYVDAGDTHNAITSMLSDLNKHPETELAPGMGGLLMLAAYADPSPASLRKWIEVFN